MTRKSIIFISGRNSNPKRGLAKYLRAQFDLLAQVAIDPNFLKHDFEDQVRAIYEFLAHYSEFTSPPTVVAHSYGAYLILHSVIAYKCLPMKLLLLSPITGFGSANGMKFMAPGRKKMIDAITKESFPKLHGSILVGTEDKQTSVEHIKAIALQSSLELYLVENQTHAIEPSVVQNFIGNKID